MRRTTSDRIRAVRARRDNVENIHRSRVGGGVMTSADFRDDLLDATTWVEATDHSDCILAVRAVFDLAIDALCRDPHIACRSRAQWELYFADVMRRAEDILINQFADLV